MKKYQYPVFSNGTGFDNWMARNCERCVKSSKYNEKTNTCTKYRCAINREIIYAYLDDGRASERTYNVCQNADCPYIQTDRKRHPKKPKFNNQPNLFEK